MFFFFFLHGAFLASVVGAGSCRAVPVITGGRFELLSLRSLPLLAEGLAGVQRATGGILFCLKCALEITHKLSQFSDKGQKLAVKAPPLRH